MSDEEASLSENELLSATEKRKLSQEFDKNEVNKKRKKELLKPPTAEELNQLRETENLYSSNLIRLQIKEVLSEISVKEKYLDQIELWWNNFCTVLKSLKDEEGILLSEIKQQVGKKLSRRSKFINELYKNRTELKHDKDFLLKFSHAESYSIFGEYQLQCLTKSDLQVNVNIRIPTSCLSLKDYLNNRYFIKRHYYLVYLLYSIKEKISACKAELALYENLNFLPFMRIIPQFSEKVTINVFVTTNNFFNLNRFLPDKNNIKYDFDDNFKDIVAKDFGEVGTPKHNSFIARECTLDMNYEFMQTLLNAKNVQDGIKLLILWLTQREMNKGLGSFTNELIFYTITYLVKKKKVNAHMSSYQVVRIFWSFLKDSKWNEEPISLSEEIKIDMINTFKENYDIVFLDVSGSFNITSFLHLGVYLRLKQEAELALQILDGNSFNSFSSLFLMKIPFPLQYDALIMLNAEDKFNVIYNNASQERKWKYYGFYRDLIVNEIGGILNHGLADRVSSIVPYIYRNGVEYNSNESNIAFGINLNPEFAFNVIERGPPEDNQAAVRKFQEFWKGLTSFRRFQDSSVAEVVYFQCRTLQDKRNIFVNILEFLFKKKYPLELKVVGNQLEKVLKLENTIIHFPTGTNEEACLKIKHIYSDLNKILRNLELPLIITNIQGTSDAFSYTEVFPPISTTYKEDENLLLHDGNKLTLKPDAEILPRHVSPIQCVMQMGKSSGWPDDVSILRCMKCEFYIRLSELLECEHNIMSSVTLDYMDVFFEGLVFRIRLFVPKELVLLKKIVDNEGVISYKDNEESLKLEKDMDVLPKVTSALSGIHQTYPSFGPSCALIKRWLRCQLIDSYHISDVVINLWNASVYLNDPPYKIAQLPQVAFLRFLRYLMDFDWKVSPVIVNFNDAISSTELSDIEAQFQQNRSSYPNLYIIMPYDQKKSIFTKLHPSKHILKRIRLLANGTYRFLNDTFLKWNDFSVKDIFAPNLQGYDVLIYLKDSINPVSYQSLFLNRSDKQYIERYDKGNSNKIPVIDFNPVDKYIKELREIYGEYAIFFNDPYGGNVIGVLWNKQVLEPRDFKVLHVNAKKIIDGKLTINYDAILEDIYNRGHGIIKNIKKM